jgi:tetratricopeptide (TPR) repeat protein
MDTKAIVFVRNGSGPSNARRPIAVDCRTMNLLPSAEKPLHGRREEAERYEELANASAIYAVLGRYGEAQNATDFAESLHSGDPTLAYVEAQTAVGMRRDDEAEVILKDALSKRQTDAGWYDLGMLYVHQRRYPEAISAMENSASFSYADYERYALIANIDLLEHFPQKALISFSQAERRSPYGKNSAFEAGIAEGQAAAYMQLQQPAKAVGLERLALLQSPGNQQRKNALARYCKAAGMNCAEISR